MRFFRRLGPLVAAFTLCCSIHPAVALDTWDKAAVTARYLADFAGTTTTRIDSEWNGNIAAGIEGTTGAAYREKMIRRVNFYRAMAGVPDDVREDVGLTPPAQRAALTMAAAGAISHTPKPGWPFYSEAVAQTADTSLLALSANGLAIDGYMVDFNHNPPGHRNWLLLPDLVALGIGDISAGPDQQTRRAAVTTPVTGTTRSARHGFSAWPPPGYVPYSLVYPLWSLNAPDTDMGAAQVKVMEGNVNLNAVLSYRGQTNITWTLPGYPHSSNGVSGEIYPHLPRPAAERFFTVTISNVKTGAGSPRADITYSLVMYDPMAGQSLETGWYHDPREMGVGYALEPQGSSIVVALFAYELSGRPTWQFTGAPFPGSETTLPLTSFINGQIFGSPTPKPPIVLGGNVRDPALVLLDTKRAALNMQGVSKDLRRFSFGNGGPDDLQTGWYWTPSESGTGWFVEQQGSKIFAGLFGFEAISNSSIGRAAWWVLDLTKSATGQFTGMAYRYTGGCQALASDNCANRASGSSTAQAAIYQQADGSLRAVVGNVTKTLVRFRL